MQIAKLRLKNFRNHKASEFELDRINIFRGPHGAGKSSIQMALELLLTGRCAVTDQGGRGGDALISEGERELNVWAQLAPADSSGCIDITRNGNSATLRVQAPDFGTPDRLNRNAVAWIEHYIAPIAVLSAVLNAGRFLELDPKEQKALLGGALAAEPVEIAKEIQDLFFNVLGQSPVPTAVRDAAAVDLIHERAFAFRTVVNRDIKNLGEVAPPAKPEGMPELDGVRYTIGEIQSDRDKVIVNRNQKLAGHNERKLRLESAQAQKKQLEPYVLESAELEEIRKALKQETKAAKLDAAISAIESEIARLRTERTAASAEADRLAEPHTDQCPTCGQKIAGAAELRNSRKFEINAKVEKLDAAIEDAKGKLETKRVDRRTLPDLGLMKEKLNRHQTASVSWQRACTTIEEIGELGPDPDVAAEDQELEALADRLGKGRAIEAQIIEYEGKLKQHQQVTERRTKLEEQSKALDRLVEYFSDRGPLKAKLVGDKLPAFVERINQVLDRFGFQCVFTLEPYLIVVDILGADGNVTTSLHLNQLSESERYRFAIAFQIALAEATGVNLVVIDRADILLPPARAALIDSLLNSNLEQAFVLAAGEPGSVPEIPGLKLFELGVEEVAHA